MSLSVAGLLKLQKKEARWRGGIKIPLECNSNVLVCGRSLDYRRKRLDGGEGSRFHWNVTVMSLSAAGH